MKKTLTKFPGFGTPPIRKIYFLLKHMFDVWTHKRKDTTPPDTQIFVGGGDYEKISKDFFGYFKDIGELKQAHTVLDVGCGQGRMAVPLTSYLRDGGRYEGFDIVKDGIEWCNKKIGLKFRNFNFQHVDIINERYNPCGKIRARDFKFPYQDGTFDFVFLTSVFTHMLPDDVENYFSEISRVLKVEGNCLISYFLLNEESKSLAYENRGIAGVNDFKYDYGVYSVMDREVPEAVVAYSDDYICRLYSKNSLKICEPIHFGSWCGRIVFLSYQDIVLATKK